jgi:hypothetical protein
MSLILEELRAWPLHRQYGFRRFALRVCSSATLLPEIARGTYTLKGWSWVRVEVIWRSDLRAPTFMLFSTFLIRTTSSDR